MTMDQAELNKAQFRSLAALCYAQIAAGADVRYWERKLAETTEAMQIGKRGHWAAGGTVKLPAVKGYRWEGTDLVPRAAVTSAVTPSAARPETARVTDSTLGCQECGLGLFEIDLSSGFEGSNFSVVCVSCRTVAPLWVYEDDIMDLARSFLAQRPAETPGATRLCACGCGKPVTSPRPEAKYASGACRVRAHRAAARE